MQHDTSPPYAPLTFFTFMMLLAPITNWEPHGATLTGYCYAMRHKMKVQIVTIYCVSHLQCYGVTVHGNVTSVYPPLHYCQTILLSSITHFITKVSSYNDQVLCSYNLFKTSVPYTSLSFYGDNSIKSFQADSYTTRVQHTLISETELCQLSHFWLEPCDVIGLRRFMTSFPS
jgi:hypothetical protein